MGAQRFIMSRPRLAMKMMSSMPSGVHVRSGRRHVLTTLKEALTRTRAYPRFLEERGVTLGRNPTFEDYEGLPVMDKDSYIKKYPLADLVLDGRLDTGYTLETSSGHSGDVYYWPRTPEEDDLFPTYLEFAFRQFYGIGEKSTLIIISLALGTWTSGEKMSQALREVAASGRYRLTVVTPGTDVTEILRIVQEISPLYEQTVLVGYPPFVKHVLDCGDAEGLDWKSYGMQLGLGGEGYSEEWRTFMAERIGRDADRDLLAVSGGYGAADLGMTVGREYPLTVLIRRLASKDGALCEALFPDGVPNLFQYSPSRMYVEELGGELVFATRSGIPLVRYNIHDAGGVLAFDDVLAVLSEFGHDPGTLLSGIGFSNEHVWRLPFFYCYGRSDGSVSVCGSIVHPEHLTAALCIARDTAVSGHKAEIVVDAEFRQAFHVHLELHDDVIAGNPGELADRYEKILLDGLREVNTEFRHASADHIAEATPVVHVHPAGTGPFAKDKKKIKRRYTM
jgi:phenylacetate-CoA ligase